MKFEVDAQAAQEALREGIDCVRAWGVTATGLFKVDVRQPAWVRIGAARTALLNAQP